jgi:hypothetical protein|eukprot:COSAG01_NODE_31539_length_595_cov_28.112903_1_plen_79_part_00
MSVMDDESVAFAATSVHVLSPFSPPLCSCLALGGVLRSCSRGLKVRAVGVVDRVQVCDGGCGDFLLFLEKLCDVLARL